MKKKIVLSFCSIILVLSFLSFLPIEATSIPRGNITFQPNVIPELSIHFVEEFFRFEWLGNRFDLKLLIHCEGKNLSLRDFWEKSDRLVKWNMLKNQATESMVEFGYMIEDIPSEISVNVEYLLWKIEGASFDVSEIELEEIEVFEEDYNITRFHLPDNLVLSYEDLWLYDFTVSHPSKTETIVKGVKGKSSWNLDPITFSGGVITITGYSTEGTACDHEEIWTQIANETRFAKQGEDQYSSDARIVIGDGENTTWFVDTKVQVSFNNTAFSANYQYAYHVKANSHLRFGVLTSATEKTGKEGVEIQINAPFPLIALRIIRGDANSEVLLYSCSLVSDGYYESYLDFYGTAKLYQCNIDRVLIFIYSGSDVDLFDVWNKNGGGIVPYGGTTITINRFSQYFSHRGIRFYYAYGGDINNLYVRGNPAQDVFLCTSITVDHNIINGDIDDWLFYWYLTNTAEVYRQYTFDLTTLFENQTAVADCNVSLTDVDDTELFNVQTDANGQIAQQTVTYGFYNQTGGDTIYLKSPHTLKVFKKGVRMYESVFNITDKTDLTLTLTPRAWNAGIPSGSITYGSNAITVSNFTQNDPCTFQDICDVNDENGWGMVDAIGTNMFFFEQCKLIIGDGSTITYFEDKGVQVTFGNGVDWFIAIEVDDNATAIFGELVDAETKTTRRGCSFVFHYTDGFECWKEASAWESDVYFYDCKFTGLPDVVGGELESYAGVYFEGNGTIYNSIFSFMYEIGLGDSIYNTTSYDIYNVYLSNMTNRGSYLYSLDSISIEELDFSFVPNYLYINSWGNITLRNISGRNATTSAFLMHERDNINENTFIHLVDAEIDDWTFTWENDAAALTYLFRQYSLDLTVTYPNGTAIENANVTVKHYGQGETQDFTELTDSNGQIATKTLSMGFYNQTGGDTIYSYNPYNIEITNATGYQTYSANFTLSEKTEWEISLTEEIVATTGFNSTYYLLGSIGAIPFMLLFAVLIIRRRK